MRQMSGPAQQVVPRPRGPLQGPRFFDPFACRMLPYAGLYMNFLFRYRYVVILITELALRRCIIELFHAITYFFSAVIDCNIIETILLHCKREAITDLLIDTNRRFRAPLILRFFFFNLGTCLHARQIFNVMSPIEWDDYYSVIASDVPVTEILKPWLKFIPQPHEFYKHNAAYALYIIHRYAIKL